MDINTAASLITILLFIWGWIRWGGKYFSKFRILLSRLKSPFPKETIKIIRMPNRDWWHMGSTGGKEKKPAMQIVCHFNVTNITKIKIYLLATRIKEPKLDGHIMVKHHKTNLYSRYHAIMPHSISEAGVDFWLQPPIKKEGEELIATIVIVDQFGNEHERKDVIFPYQ
jgi:extradiol dioxygenase family protein